MNAGVGLRAAWLAAIGLCAASVLLGQSLGDLARREKERRASQTQACPPHVITNDDLLQHHVEAPVPPSPTPAAAVSRPQSPASTTTTASGPPTELERAERYWRQRASHLRRAVKSAEQRIASIRGST